LFISNAVRGAQVWLFFLQGQLTFSNHVHDFFVCVFTWQVPKPLPSIPKKKTFTKKGKHFLSKITEEQLRVK